MGTPKHQLKDLEPEARARDIKIPLVAMRAPIRMRIDYLLMPSGGGPITPGLVAEAERSSRTTVVAGPSVRNSLNSEAGPNRPRAVRTGSFGLSFVSS